MTRPPSAGDDWRDLAEMWTAPTPGQSGPDPALLRAIRRRARLGRLNFLAEAWGSVLAGLVGAVVGWRQGSPALAIAVFAFAGFGLAMALWARRGLGPEAAETPAGALRVAAAQARSGLRWARAGQAVGLAALLFVGFVGATRAVVATAPALAFAAVFLVACFALYERHARRSRDRLRRHEAALAELED